MGCNMRCGHCGSSCENRLPDELTTEEALSLADQIADLGLSWITLSGGEPLIREDLPILVQRLASRGVIVNMITNGWLIDLEVAQTLKESGISTVAISIDGTEEIHDSIRMAGSFKRIEKAISHLKHAGINVGAVTTISNKNFDCLRELHQILIDMGVKSWQVQLGQPMGNFKERPQWVSAPGVIPAIIDFCYETWLEGQINIRPADCIGYYSEKEMIIRQKPEMGGSIWNGCNAGLRSFGILQNGDILGCTSIREKSFVEGNIKNEPLAQIWNNPDNFSWRRKMTKADLVGDCAICAYGSRCLGGCPNVRITMSGDINSDNLYCSYNLAIKGLRERLLQETDCKWLTVQAEQALRVKDFQTSAFFAERALELAGEAPFNEKAATPLPEGSGSGIHSRYSGGVWGRASFKKKALAIKGFAEFMCGNYSLCEAANRKALELYPNDTYALKGLGLALHKLGDSEQGLKLIEEAAKLTNYADADIMHDLNYVRQEMKFPT